MGCTLAEAALEVWQGNLEAVQKHSPSQRHLKGRLEPWPSLEGLHWSAYLEAFVNSLRSIANCTMTIDRASFEELMSRGFSYEESTYTREPHGIGLIVTLKNSDVIRTTFCPWHTEHFFKYATLNIVRRGLSDGADADIQCFNGMTPLHMVIKNPCSDTLEVIRTLLNAGANIDATDEWGKTPLHYAINSSYSTIVEVLIDAGANIQIEYLGSTPLHYARVCHNSDAERLLLEAGAT